MAYGSFSSNLYQTALQHQEQQYQQHQQSYQAKERSNQRADKKVQSNQVAGSNNADNNKHNKNSKVIEDQKYIKSGGNDHQTPQHVAGVNMTVNVEGNSCAKSLSSTQYSNHNSMKSSTKIKMENKGNDNCMISNKSSHTQQNQQPAHANATQQSASCQMLAMQPHQQQQQHQQAHHNQQVMNKNMQQQIVSNKSNYSNDDLNHQETTNSSSNMATDLKQGGNTQEVQSIGVYTPDSTTNSVHSLHQYGQCDLDAQLGLESPASISSDMTAQNSVESIRPSSVAPHQVNQYSDCSIQQQQQHQTQMQQQIQNMHTHVPASSPQQQSMAIINNNPNIDNSNTGGGRG